MRKRYMLGATGVALLLCMAGGLLFSGSGSEEKGGVVRIAAPVAMPRAAPITGPVAIAPPAPSPTPTTEPGIDPPPPPQERNSPDYAKLGVQPAI